ncbi:fibronectin type III domain-containing protein [Planctomicrobium sp. SH664]|uniref:fibronectin type III domain-containing protein n=1 Tax=Planctomicrobium sp. SH664 TaxID=3448125 RepID=UPI003F5BD501
MHDLNRRHFLQASLAGLSAIPLFGHSSLIWSNEAAADGFFPLKPKDTPPDFRNGNPDTLFLTWQRDPTTTILPTWVSGELPEAQARIHIAKVGEETWYTFPTQRRNYPVPELFVYRAEATGLEPGTQYQLKIGTGTEILRFQTMPAKITNSFQFVSGGDSGPKDDARTSNLLAASQDPMFVLMGGDIAYDVTSAGARPGANLQFLKNYRADMLDSAKRLIPIVPAIGNHEAITIRDARVAPFFSALYAGLFPEQTYATLDFGDYLSLVLLDTGHIAPIDEEQTSWLNHQLRERTERPHLIVAQHVPSYPSYRSFEKSGVESREHWVPLFEKFNVDVVLEHHDHTFKRTHPLKDGLIDKNGLVFLGDGSWGALRSLHDVEPRPYMASTSSNYHVTLHRIEGDRRFHIAMTHSGRLVDICTTQKRPQHPMGRGA